MRLLPLLCALLITVMGSGCTTIMNQATSGLSANVSSAILNQNDPEIVRDGAPALLLMLDSFVEGAPQDESTLISASELYAMYGALFVQDNERAGRLTTRSLELGERALCAANESACGLADLNFSEYEGRLQDLREDDVTALYMYSVAWFAFIKAHSAEMSALSKLPRGEAALRRVQEIEPNYRRAEVEHYLGVLNTIRPPMLGGKFELGREHFEESIELSNGRNLAVKVDFARYYARTLYERELHDELLNQVVDADPEQSGLTLFNVLAQREARELLDSADEYF